MKTRINNGEIKFDLVEHYAYKAMRAETANAPMPDNMHIGQTIVTLAQKQGPSSNQATAPFALPCFIWGIYYNKDGSIAGVDAIERSKKTGVHSPYPLDFSSDGDLLCRDSNNPCAASSLNSNFLRFIPNRKDSFVRLSHETIKPELLPDIILRRAAALVYYRDEDILHPINPDDFQGLERRGIVMNSVLQKDCRFPKRALDTDFYPIKQKPVTIPGYLDQDDIDTIAAIAMNYVSFCWAEQRLVVWPQTGTWQNWPERFMRFTYDRNPNIDIDVLQADLKSPSRNAPDNIISPALSV